MIKVLVLGSSGMLGHQVYNYLKHNSDYSLTNLANRRKLQDDTVLVDVRNEKKFIYCINKIQPHFIINCIGVLIRDSNANPDNAVFLNSYLPLMLAGLSKSIGAKLIHISTDCVFSGNKKTPYTENDEKDGKDLYSITKGLGEPITNNSLTIRTSIVGPELKGDGEGLFHWFMNQSGSINGYRKAIWSGVTTLELAKAIKWAIDNEITGLYHITNNQTISKYELLNLFKQYTKKQIEILPVDGHDSDKSIIDTRKLINYAIPSYDQMISNMISLTHNNGLLYSEYQLNNISEK